MHYELDFVIDCVEQILHCVLSKNQIDVNLDVCRISKSRNSKFLEKIYFEFL